MNDENMNYNNCSNILRKMIVKAHGGKDADYTEVFRRIKPSIT